MSKAPTLTEQREQLQAAYEQAKTDQSASFDRQLRKRSEAPAEVLAPLLDFYSAIEHKRPDAVDEDERDARLAELTDDFFTTLKDRGLALKPVRTPDGWGLSVTDSNIDADHTAAVAATNAANAALREFDREHGDALLAERKKADADAIREALKGDDPDAIRAALEQREESDRTARQRTADALASGAYEGWEDDSLRSTPVSKADALTSADLPG